ncbi:MAG: DNA-directed RNA polymerase subunit omega [Clostridiaceae bacterium]|nr:DNA-directed RNA polymerase subunit omega [Clostridiaceae bacterium]
MMIDPNVTALLAKIPNRYMIVNVAAARARDISQQAEDEELYLDDKPVTLALREIAEGKLHIVPKIEEEKEENAAK